MLVRSPDEIIQEIRGVVAARAEIIRASVDGRFFFHKQLFASDRALNEDRVTWILHAQSGTLDKVGGLFERDGIYETFELLAIARNLFENLVWLRLFNLDLQYGHLFYEILIKQQIENIERNIEKIESEIELFKACEQEDGASVTQMACDVNGHSSEEEMKTAPQSHSARQANLDEKVRRAFALYGAAAKFNGYGYQVHLLQTKVIPHHQQVLAKCSQSLAEFEAIKSSVLDAKLANATKWNWRERSRDVGMIEQYDFLYRYTSKLLHSTPMNLITDKELSDSERLLMLDYSFITICDIYDEIEKFSFPGAVNALLVRTDT